MVLTDGSHVLNRMSDNSNNNVSDIFSKSKTQLRLMTDGASYLLEDMKRFAISPIRNLFNTEIRSFTLISDSSKIVGR